MSEYTRHNPAFGEVGNPNSFDYLYGVASGRLQEALGLQHNSRYRHAWVDPSSGLPHELVGLRLTEDFDQFMAGGAPSFDLAIPVTSSKYDESGLLVAAEVLEGENAYFVVSTDRFAADSGARYVINRGNVEVLNAYSDEIVRDIDSKLFTYTIVPFRLQEKIA